jgi:uncharacterized protein YciI
VKHFVLMYELVSDYVTRRAPLRAAHLALAQASVERDELQLGGALVEEPLGLLLFKAETAELVERFAAQDPYVVHGVVKAYRIREWAVAVGRLGREALTPART